MALEQEIVIAGGTRAGILPTSPRRPTVIVWVEAIGGLVWAALCSSLVLRIFAETATPPPIVYSFLAILLGIVLADFISGFFHWFFDTFFEETTPLIGWYVIAPFREHHRDPMAVTRHSFLELTGNTFLGCILPLALVWWFADSPETHWDVFHYTWWLSMAIALAVTNQLHCWAHQSSPPRFARWLQSCRIALSAAQHARHHAPPHRSAYCITNGWTNRLADRLRVFVWLEKLFVALGVPRATAGESQR